MSFYTFRQTNSGGYYTVNKKLGHYVIIEAEYTRHATEIAKDIGIYFNGCDIGIDCKCCGDRWHELYSNDGCESLSDAIYGVDLTSAAALQTSIDREMPFVLGDSVTVFVYYANGTVLRAVYSEDTVLSWDIV